MTVNKFIVSICALALAAAGTNAGAGQNAAGVIAVSGNTADLAVPGTAGETAQWTVMVFANGKNNLETYAINNLKQMERVGSSGKMNVVMELGRYKNDNTNGALTGCSRYLIRKSADPVNITSPVLQASPKCDMGDYQEAIGFGKWAMSAFPARHYMFIIMNHGSGWSKSLGADSAPNPALDLKKRFTKGISYDDETKRHINTPQLAQVLRALGHVDVFATDACLMQMAEVDAEIKPYADYIVGSEDASTGYNYDDILNHMAQSDLSADAAARSLVEFYRGDTQSYLAAKSMEKLYPLITGFARAVMDSNEKAAARAARDSAQAYYEYTDNKDLYDFVSRVVAGSSSPAVKAAGTALMDYISQALVLDNKAPGVSDKNSHGIAIYAPDKYYNEFYDELVFAKETNWPVFLRWLLH